MKVLCRNEWCHTEIYLLVMHLILHFHISMGVCFHVLIVLAQDGYPIRTRLVGPYIVIYHVLSYLYARLVVPAREGYATFHLVCMLHVCCCDLYNLLKMDYCFLDNGFVL